MQDPELPQYWEISQLTQSVYAHTLRGRLSPTLAHRCVNIGCSLRELDSIARYKKAPL